MTPWTHPWLYRSSLAPQWGSSWDSTDQVNSNLKSAHCHRMTLSSTHSVTIQCWGDTFKNVPSVSQWLNTPLIIFNVTIRTIRRWGRSWANEEAREHSQNCRGKCWPSPYDWWYGIVSMTISINTYLFSTLLSTWDSHSFLCIFFSRHSAVQLRSSSSL